MSQTAIINALREARLSGEKLASYPGPTPSSMAEAFAIQSAVRTSIGWTHAGWKIGCTSEKAQKALHTDGPFPGPVYRERLFPAGSPCRNTAQQQPHHRTGNRLHHGPRSARAGQALVRG